MLDMEKFNQLLDQVNTPAEAAAFRAGIGAAILTLEARQRAISRFSFERTGLRAALIVLRHLGAVRRPTNRD